MEDAQCDEVGGRRLAVQRVHDDATEKSVVRSVVAAGVYPFIVFAMLLGSPERAPVTWVAALIAVLVIIRHIPNIRRILSGTEPAIFGRKREDHA